MATKQPVKLPTARAIFGVVISDFNTMADMAYRAKSEDERAVVLFELHDWARSLGSCLDEQDNFTDKLAVNPAQTLSWADNIFINAAEVQVFGSFLVAAHRVWTAADGASEPQRMVSFKKLTASCKEECNRKLRQFPRTSLSSSPCSNLYETATAVKTANLLEKLERLERSMARAAAKK